MSLISTQDLTRGRQQRDSALADARRVRKMVTQALGKIKPARKQAVQAWREWQSIHAKVTREKIFDKDKRVTRGILRIILPEISKAYMAAHKDAPKAIKVIEEVTSGLQAAKKNLDATISALQAIEIPSEVGPGIATIPAQVQTARNSALKAIDDAGLMLDRCGSYRDNAIPFIRSARKLVARVNDLSSKRVTALKKRGKLVPLKAKRLSFMQKLKKKSAMFVKKLNAVEGKIDGFVKSCPSERQKLSRTRREVSAILLPGMSPAPAPPRGSGNVFGGSPDGHISPREAVAAMLYAQTPGLQHTHYFG